MLNQLTISELHAKLTKRAVSVREVVQACLDQIKRVDPQVRALRRRITMSGALGQIGLRRERPR